MSILDYFRSSEPDPAETERRYAEAYPELVGKTRETIISEQIKKFEETGARNRATQRVVPAAIARLPTAILEGVQGIDQIISSFGESSGSIPENLQRGRYVKGGFDKVQGLLAEKQAEWQAANPDATPEQVKEFVSKYQNTPEYVNFERQQIPTAYRINEEIADKIDSAFAVPTDNLKTNKETIIQAVTQAAVPVNILKGLPTAARIVGEFLLPGNQAQTTAGKTAVGLTAGGITAGITTGLGRDVKEKEFTELNETKPIPSPKYAELNIDDGIPATYLDAEERIKTAESFTSVIPASSSLAAFGAVGAALFGVRPKTSAIPSKPGVVADSTATAAGKSYDASTNAVNTLFDERAPVVRAISRANRDLDDPTNANKLAAYKKAVEESNEAGIYSVSAAGTTKTSLEQLGMIGGQQITPMRTMFNIQKELVRTGEDQDIDLFLVARTELNRRMESINDINTNLQNKYIDLVAAKNSNQTAKANDILAEIEGLQTKLTEQYAKRPNLQQYDNKQLEEIVNKGPQSELGRKYVEIIDENQKTLLNYPVKMGVLEPEEVKRIGDVHNGTHVPLMEDPFKGTEGVARLFSKVEKKANSINDPVGDLSARINPFMKRLDDPNHTPDFLMKPHEAIAMRADQLISWVHHEKYKQDIIGKILAGKNNKEVLEVFQDTHGKTAFSQKQAEFFDAGTVVKLRDYIPVRLEGNKGRVSFVKFTDEHKQLDNMLRAGPAAQSLFGAVTRMVQRGATGVFQTGFAPMSTALENFGFQVLRPRGSVGYVDNAAFKLNKKLTDKNLSDTSMTAIRMATVPADALIGQIDAVLKAGEQWWKLNRIINAHHVLESLETGSGWFGAMMNIPEFKAVATKWATGVVDTFHDTTMGALVDGKGMTFNTLVQNMEHTNTLFKQFEIDFPNAIKMAATPFTLPINQYKMFITAYRDATKYAYYTRQIEYLKLKNGVEELDAKTIKRLQNETRSITGDFTKRMGNKYLQTFDDTVPYFRVMIQSTKNAYQRIVNDPMLATAVISGLVIPKIMMEYELANWDKEAYDWYYRGSTPMDRAGFIGFIRPDIFVRRHILGENIPFKPEYVHKLYTPQEFRGFVEASAAAMRGLGAYKAGQKDRIAGADAGGTQIGEALKAAFGISTPPMLAAALAPKGIKIELGNVFTDEKIVQPPRREDDVNRLLADNTSITRGMHDTVGAILGTLGKSLAQGFASGEQIYKKTDSISEAIWGGVKEAAQRNTNIRQSPVMWVGNVNERRYRTTAVTQELYKNREAFSVIRNDKAPAAFKTDDLLGTIADELKRSGKSMEANSFKEQYKEISTRLNEIENNRSTPLWSRQELQKEDLKKFHQLSIEQQKWMLKEQDEIGRIAINGGTIGDLYKKRFGEEFTLKNFAKLAKEMKAKEPRR